MSDIIRIQGHSYILATSPRIGGRHLTLKQGDSFAVFDRFGDLGTVGAAEQGVYHRGTRVLSQHEFRLGTQRPLLLSSNAHERHPFVAADLTNPDIQMGEQRVLPRGTIHIFRAQFLWEGALYHRIRVHNYGDVALESDLLFLFDADFLDVFEVRGMKRAQHGTRRHEVGETWVRLCYDGLDGLTRQARLEFSTRPAELTAGSARFSVRLPPDQPIDLLHVVSFEQDPGEPPSLELFGRRREELVAPREPPHAGMVSTTNEYFNHWIDRSVADLHMLVTETDHGPYPYAGVPWFSTVFGRDGLITALQCLWLDPRMAKGVLSLLAHTQASEERASQDAEPGKIVHEMRDGEMANLGEVPYFRYYGSADSTPLFLMLAAAYFERTGDRALIEAIWPNLERALDWIDHYGDLDGDGLVEYSRRRPDGLVNQGWKDSDDSVSHADGALAQGPIALCEVQGYVYAAKRDIAGMAHRCGRAALGGRLEHEAERLRQAVEERFWLEELGTYALALDGAKRPCRVKASNAGHLLFCGLPGRERAHRVADTLLQAELNCGWGIRTLGDREKRYNPMSYHNGSVWPHDNAIIAAGLARYGLTDRVMQVLTGLFDAALHVDLNRLPELYCGFTRQSGQGPTLYPVACIPQAWAAGAVFQVLQASLGLTITADPPQVVFMRPHLPPFLQMVELRGLRVGAGSIDLQLIRHPRNVSCTVRRRDGDIPIRVEM